MNQPMSARTTTLLKADDKVLHAAWLETDVWYFYAKSLPH